MPSFHHKSLLIYNSPSISESVLLHFMSPSYFTGEKCVGLFYVSLMNAFEHLFMWLKVVVFFYFPLSCWYFLIDFSESFIYHENRPFACDRNYKYISFWVYFMSSGCTSGWKCFHFSNSLKHFFLWFHFSQLRIWSIRN